MPAPLRFGLAFGSLVFVRALLDGVAANIAITLVMFLFFAGVSGAAYFGAGLLLKGRLFITAILTALALLLLITIPSLLAAPLSTMIAARIIVRVFFAWLYVCMVFAGFSSIVGMKIKSLAVLAVAPLALFAQLAEEFAPPRANCCLQTTAQTLADQLQDWNQLGRYHADNARLDPQPGRVVFRGTSYPSSENRSTSSSQAPAIAMSARSASRRLRRRRAFTKPITSRGSRMIAAGMSSDSPITHTHAGMENSESLVRHFWSVGIASDPTPAKADGT